MVTMQQRIAWHYFKFTIPDDWEPTAYATDPAHGGLTFATRHGFQGVVRWQAHRRAPDPTREMLDYLQSTVLRGKARRIRNTEGFQITDVGGFTILRHETTALPVQAMRYLGARRMTIHWSFPDSRVETLRQQWTPLLESFETNDGAVREYMLFGIHGCLPSRFAVTGLQAFPANVRITFAAGSHSLRLCRWGLLSVTLNALTPADFLRREIEREGGVCDSVETAGHGAFTAVTITFHERHADRTGARFRQFRRPRRMQGVATVWLDAKAHRLYAIEQRWTGDASPLAAADVCPSLRRPEGI